MKDVNISKLDQDTPIDTEHTVPYVGESFTPTEARLADVWREVLGVRPAGRTDNFFELGGDSITAMQVISRVRTVFNVELSIQDFFGASMLSEMSIQIDLLVRRSPLFPPPAITPVPRDQALPLSFSQERMWFIHQLDPNSSAYNEVIAIRLTGNLDIAALRYSLSEMVKRHESLRTTFPAIHGQPVQVIAPYMEIPIKQIDLRRLLAGEREDKVQQLLTDEAALPFDIAQGPLLRVTMIITGAQEQILTMLMHHLITDAWSEMVLLREFMALYNAAVAGESPHLPSLRVQYADYAYWQRQWLTAERFEAHMSYWRDQLANISPLDLTTDHPRPAIQTFRGSFISDELDEDLLDSLRRVATSEGATTFMVGLAAFQALLYHYTSQTDISVGVPIANREWPQSEQLIGALVNTLAMRVDLSGNPTFRELLRRVRAVALDAYLHQNMPFAKLVAELNPVRDISYSPLVQVMFNMINVPLPEMQLDAMQTEYVRVDRGAAQFDLTFTVIDVPDICEVTVEFNLDLFERETVERMLGHYLALLRAIVTDPDQPIDSLPLLSEAERRCLLDEWNTTDVNYDLEQALHVAFESQVLRTPYATAIRFGDCTLTYAKLNSRANQLARYLIQCGASPDTLIGICMARCPDVIVAILATLKAGCAYVPLDPAYPAVRLEYMIHDARIPIVLTHGETMGAVIRGVAQHQARVINLDADEDAIRQYSTDNLNVLSRADGAAYVIYTSGSTGKPKGVIGTHHGALNRAHWMWRVYPFEPGEVLCQKTSLNFIDSVWEIFGPLLRGVPTVILPDATVKDIDELVREMAHYGVTRVTLVPSLLKALLETHPNLRKELPSLKMCVSSGETLPAILAKQFVQQMPHTRLLNLYGSSEASGDSTYYEVTAQSPNEFVPIGKPMDNVRAYVLDARLQPVPVGVPGELFIGGDGLALGYLNQPEMTATRFVANPFSDDPGGRLYRTGDIVRYLPDGNLQYLGRCDDQVKIRGMRVTTGEIESVLKQHPAIAEAVVITREDYSGNAQLVAYVVSYPQTSIVLNDLRAFAERQLPGHMVPSAFIALPALPLIPNGKLDKRALPAWEGGEKRDTTAIVEPSDVVERKLLAIWQRLLERPTISMTDDFFDLGGHSLLAVQLFSEIQREFAVKLQLSTLFQASTPKALARALRGETTLQQVLHHESPLVPIQPKGSLLPFFCVHGIGGGVIGYVALAQHLGEDQPFYGLEARPVDTGEPSTDRIETMAARYIEAIQTIQPEGPYYIGGYSYGGTVAYEMARQLHEQGHAIGLLAMFDHPAPKSGYELPHFSVTFVWGLIGNLWHWWKDFRQITPQERAGRIRRKLFIRKPAKQNGELGLSHYIDDVTLVPQEYRELMQKQFLAWEAYHPQPYDGRVTIFRTPRQPLICSYDPHLAWDLLAKGGVDVYLVAGAHRNLLEEPYVQVLATALKDALARANVC